MDETPTETTTRTVPLLVLPGGVVVPHMVVNLVVESAEAVAALDAVAEQGDEARLVLVPRGPDGDPASVGTLARVEADQVQRGRGGPRRTALVRGLERVVVEAADTHGRPPTATVTTAGEPITDPQRVEALAREYRATVEALLVRRRAGSAATLADITDPSALADTAVWSPDLDDAQRVAVLTTLDVADRLDLVLGIARDALAELSVAEEVTKRTGERLESAQREAILRQQMAAIRAELGDDDDVADRYRTRVAEADLPDHVRAAVDTEIDRLERMSEQSPEHGWIRTWLDTVLDVPWGHTSSDDLDLARARDVLDADHTGLEEVKDRIIEFLAVRRLRAERGLGAPSGRGTGAILALVGPPGVGKTSLGESIARAMGRTFARVALGGVRDEAEIRGHRRTYVGAQPGRLVRALREAGTMNPVILIDEIDKVAADWRGDPTAALLEVLDPAQNHTFRDHYLEVDLDLSDVVFVATGNVADQIPGPLADRLEMIRVDGYTESEKAAIARAHLLPAQLERAGLTPSELEVDDETLRAVIDGWTREAGVRGLERHLGRLARKAATRLATGVVDAPVRVRPGDLRDLLGRPPLHRERPADRLAVPGVATGLAVTGAGGDVLFIEASRSDGEPGLTLTGQLGDVMRESATIAVSYVRSHAGPLGVDPEPGRLHLHVPAGAVPKDGPSAGITMVTALASLLTGRTVATDLGMTGEVTLTGRVLPIGGVKQKLLAAHRFGLRRVLLPRANAEDLADVPDTVLADVETILVDDVADVLDVALVAPDPAGLEPLAA